MAISRVAVALAIVTLVVGVGAGYGIGYATLNPQVMSLSDEVMKTRSDLSETQSKVSSLQSELSTVKSDLQKTSVELKTKADLDKVRSATQKYVDYRVALKDGYAPLSPHVPNMGIHFASMKLLEAPPDPLKPPMLLYVEEQDMLRLVGVEYAVPEPVSPQPPELIAGDTGKWGVHHASAHYTDGSEMEVDSQDKAPSINPETGAPLVVWHPNIHTLHVWLYLANPDGVFAEENPNVSAEFKPFSLEEFLAAETIRLQITQGEAIVEPGKPPLPGLPETMLPQTLDEAKAQGWVPLGEPGKPPECVPNMGIHAARIVEGKPDVSLLLLFNTKGELIGIELESLKEQPSPPWEHLEHGHPGMEFEHWTLHIYLKDPSIACG